MDRESIRELQLERLQNQVKRVYENVAAYRERMDKAGVKPEDIKELSVYIEAAVHYQAGFEEYYYPFELLAVPKKDIVSEYRHPQVRQENRSYQAIQDLIWTIGRTDLHVSFMAAGGSDENRLCRYHTGMVYLPADSGAHGGAEKVGAMVVPTASGKYRTPDKAYV